MKARRTEYPGIYDLDGFVAVKVNFYGYDEWALHTGTVDQYFDTTDRWVETLPTLKQAKQYAESIREAA